MASVRFASIIYLCSLCLLILKTSVTGANHPRLPVKHVALFVFGDSLYDPGNNNYINTTTRYQANFWPYGETFFGFPTGRFSNGRLIPDFISEYAKLPLIPPYLKPGISNYVYGVNFASGGAGALVESHQGLVVDLKTQLRHFKKVEKRLKGKLGSRKAKTLISSAVYLFSVGSNDYFSLFPSNSTFHKYSKKEYVEIVLGNFTQVIQKIYKIGGRKFGFVSLPPMGCLPGTKLHKPGNKRACYDKLTSLAKLHNKELHKVLRLIQSRLKGFNYSMFDLYTSMSQRMKHPLKYGFKDGNMGCCGSGPNREVDSCGGKREDKQFELCDNVGDYFFFDSVHPSEKANKQLSELIWSGNSNTTGPYNLKAFFEKFHHSLHNNMMHT